MTITTTLYKNSLTLTALVAAAVLVVPAPQAQAAVTYSPDLNPGDKFHLVRVTDDKNFAALTDIEIYNTLVQDDAVLAGLDTIFGQAVTWKVIGSTPTADARDNIGDPNSPIFNVFGSKIADNEADLWDGTLATPISIGSEDVWTGTASDGTASEEALGTNFGGWANEGPISGTSGFTDSSWIDRGMVGYFTSLSFYAISSEITYVPEPTSALMLGLALSAIGLRRRRS